MATGDLPNLAKNMPPEEYIKRRDAAGDVAEWYLGDRSWAWTILAAFCLPDQALRDLECEKEEG